MKFLDNYPKNKFVIVVNSVFNPDFLLQKNDESQTPSSFPLEQFQVLPQILP